MATTRVFWLLVLVALAIGGWRVLTGQADLRRLGQDHEYAFELEVPIRDAVGLTVPDWPARLDRATQLASWLLLAVLAAALLPLLGVPHPARADDLAWPPATP